MFTGSPSRVNKVHSLGQSIQICKDKQVEKIRDVKNRGLFAPYEAALSKPRSSWDRETWLDRINQILRDWDSKKPVSETNRLLGFLFAIAIDPEVSAEEKQFIIAEVQKPLETDQLKNFYYAFVSELPSVMSTTILRYCSRDVLEGSCKLILKRRNIHIYEKFFIHWIEETVSNKWSQEEKQLFLDNIFDVLPTETGNDVLYYFMLHSSEDLQKQLPETCSPILVKRIESLKKEVVQFGQTTLSELKSNGDRVQLAFLDNQRQYFLEWFYKNAVSHEEASLIAVGFDEKDWEWLQNRMNKESETKNSLTYHLSHWSLSPSPLIPLTMKWMTDIANRLRLEELSQNSTLRYHDSAFWLFFSNASSIIEKEKGWKDISNEDYQKFSKALTAENLFNYLKAFRGDLRNRVIKNLINDEPQKLISWLQIILKIPEDDWDQRTSGKIAELFSLISKNECLQAAIPIIFNIKQNDNVLMLSTFCALEKDPRKVILRHILLDRADGIKALTQWVKLCLLENGHLNPFVKDEFAKDIYVLLHEIDPTVTDELKDVLDQASFVESSPENQQFINFILPVGVDLSDPTVRQEEAIKKLKCHFLTPGVPSRDRGDFVSSLKKELKAEEETSVWLPKLFDQLPKETWPLIFLHFDNAIYQCSCFSDSEEMSGESEYKETKARSTTPLNRLPDIERWVDLAAQTLSQMIDNPCFKYHDNGLSNQAVWSMQHLYQTSCKTNIIHAVIQKFIETTPPALFIPTMDLFAQSCFYDNEDEFNELILTALGMLKLTEQPS